MRLSIFAMIFVMFAAPPSFAQANPVKIYVSSTSQDQLGKQLAFALRERIRSSGGYAEAYDSDSATVEIKSVTLDPDELSSQGRTIYPWTMLWNLTGKIRGLYVTSSVGICGRSKIDECAGGLFRDTGVQVDDMRAAMVEELKSRQ